ncbi:MAG: glycosyltransferase family 39 protein [Planctomycetaceae bacterium]
MVTGIETYATTQTNSESSRVFLDSERAMFLTGLLVLLVLRICYLAICPMELIPDEAYYWDWSRQLDWSYYSKPPMVAGLIAFSTMLLGTSEFAVRLPAAILGTLGLWGVYELGRRMYGHRTGLWSAVIAGVTPGSTALCLLMTIDAPFLFTWTMSVYFLWRILEDRSNAWSWVVPAILATGAGLLSKQTTLGLYPLAALFLATTPAQRSKIAKPQIWAWAIGSLAFLTPVAIWNSRHEWITFEHTRDHFPLQSHSVLRHLTWSAEFLVSQFGVLSPLICAQLGIVTIILMMQYRQLGNRERFLMCFGGFPLVAITMLSLFQRVQPNWPVALHLTCVVMMAAWKSGEISLSRYFDSRRMAVKLAVGLGVVMSFAVSIAPFILPSSALAGTRFDPTGRLRGWKTASRLISEKLEKLNSTEEVLLIAATSRAPVSEFAYYLPGQPRVYRWNVGEVIDSQHDIWGGPRNASGKNALIVTEGDAVVPTRLAMAFADIEDLGTVVVPLGRAKSRQFRIWRGNTLSDWPARRTQDSIAVQLDESTLRPSRK